jgi:maltose alpha-D-glucosyltransferase/alpha-amylase
MEKHLPPYLLKRRWFGGKARQIKWSEVREILPVVHGDSEAYVLLIEVAYVEGDGETYALPLTYASGEKAERVMRAYPQVAFLRLKLEDKGEEGVLYDAVVDKDFCAALLESITRGRRRKGSQGELFSSRTKALNSIQSAAPAPLEPRILKVEQSNTSIAYGDRFILKLFRRLHPGVNPDLEIGRFLTQKGFEHTPKVAGAIEYRKEREEPMTLGILQTFVQNYGDAWEYTRDVLLRYFETILAERPTSEPMSKAALLEMVTQEPPQRLREMTDAYLESARLLGRRTAELHVALSSSAADPAFSPEPFSKLYQRSLYQSMRNLTGQVFQLLARRRRELPKEMWEEAEGILAQEEPILERFGSILTQKVTAMRIRCHGDYHLGQVLNTGNDFIIIDFEGEPARPISERLIKRSPLRDVSGMLRSFHYAAYAALFSQKERGLVHHEDMEYLESWANCWQRWVSAVFLKAYLRHAADGDFLPRDQAELGILLDIFLLEKAVYEMGYELNNRPNWIKIPFQGIHQLLQDEGA